MNLLFTKIKIYVEREKKPLIWVTWQKNAGTLGFLINAPVRLFFRYLCALRDALILNNVCFGLKRTPGALIYLFACTYHSFSAAIQFKFTCPFFFKHKQWNQNIDSYVFFVSFHRRVHSNLSKKSVSSIVNMKASVSD